MLSLLQSVRAASCSILRTAMTAPNVAFRSMRPTPWRCSGKMSSLPVLPARCYRRALFMFLLYGSDIFQPSDLNPSIHHLLSSPHYFQLLVLFSPWSCDSVCMTRHSCLLLSSGWTTPWRRSFSSWFPDSERVSQPDGFINLQLVVRV